MYDDQIIRKQEDKNVFDNNPAILDNDFFNGGVDNSFYGGKSMTQEVAKAE